MRHSSKVAPFNLFTFKLHKFHPPHNITTLDIAHPGFHFDANYTTHSKAGMAFLIPFFFVPFRHLIARDKLFNELCQLFFSSRERVASAFCTIGFNLSILDLILNSSRTILHVFSLTNSLSSFLG